MNTINVTCPTDGERFAVVEPTDRSTYDSLTAVCPQCKEKRVIVYPDELRNQADEKPLYEPYVGEIIEWELKEDPPAPYTGSQEAIPYEQYITAKIDGLGSRPVAVEGSQSHEEAFKPDRFQIWFTPDHDEIAYVVRADLETGVKTKNVYSHVKIGDEYRYAGSLFVKNRGVPRNSDKQWTYLDLDECRARVVQAGLDGEVTPTSGKNEGRYNIFLNNDPQPLVEDGELAEDLVLELARTLIAFQTKRIN
ncbi:hypothetical protein ACFQO4_18215 [Saliphagus sp. GCM10025334]